MKKSNLLFFLFILVSSLISCSNSASFTVNTSLSSAARITIPTRVCGQGGITCAGDPQNLQFKIYKIYIGNNADCSDAQVVTDYGDSGKLVTIGSEPIVQASPADGTYNCLIFKMSDNLRFIPDSTAASTFASDCFSGTVSIHDIFRSGDTPWKDPSGGSITAHGTSSSPVDDTVYIMASTSPAAVASGSVAANPNQLLTLNSALTVPGTTTFYADFRGGVTGSGGQCKIEGTSDSGMGFK